MKLCFVRHGETDWNATGRLQGRENTHLNESGRIQALQAAEFFKTGDWTAIVSSPLQRAYDTAQIISETIQYRGTISTLDSLMERDYGEASGLLPEERHQRFPDGMIPGQEPFEKLKERGMWSIENIRSVFPDQQVIVVSHGGLINSVLYTLSLGKFGSFSTRLYNGSISCLEHRNHQWEVLFYNQRAFELHARNYDS